MREISPKYESWNATFNTEAKTVIFLYLAFKGGDYGYHISNFFEKSGLTKREGLKTIKHANKVNGLLNEMERSNLILKGEGPPATRKRKYYVVNQNTIYLRENYFLTDNEIDELKEDYRKEVEDFHNSLSNYYDIERSGKGIDSAVTCPHCREIYFAEDCWEKRKSGQCLFCQEEKLSQNEGSTEPVLISSSSKEKGHWAVEGINEEPSIPELIYDYCPNKTITNEIYPEQKYNWSEGLFINKFDFTDEEIIKVLSKFKKFDYITILLIIRELLIYIIAICKTGTINIESAHVDCAVMKNKFPKDRNEQKKFIEELVDWKIRYKTISRDYQINRILADIQDSGENDTSSLFDFLSYERIISAIGLKRNSDEKIPYMVMPYGSYECKLEGINKLISLNLMNERIIEAGGLLEKGSHRS